MTKRTFSDILTDLLQVFENEANNISNFTSSNSSFSSDVFDSPVIFYNDPPKTTKAPLYKSLYAEKGVYIFVISNSVTVSKDFNKVEYGAPLNNTSNLSFNQGDILYIGKAKSFLTRMHQHFSDADSFNKTGSLKLNSTPRKDLIGNITIYAFPLKSDYKKYYDVIAPSVESLLHEKLSPLVGTARI